MTNESEMSGQEPHAGLYGKVVGAVRTSDQLESLVEALEQIGVSEIKVLQGASGTQQLETWKETFSQYFFGDMELKMLKRYLDALAADFLVFTAAVESDQADATAETAKAHEAIDIVYFGNSAVTNY